LEGAHLFRASLYEAHLEGANLRKADLSEAVMFQAHLARADLSGADLSGADLSEARLRNADLRWAILTEADLNAVDLSEADLSGADLTKATLVRADLSSADLSVANLIGADLSNANLTRTICVETDFVDAILVDCYIYGISCWDVRLDNATQQDLCITPVDQPLVTVDNLKVAQFIYLLLNNAEIRDVIDTIARKVVLILGRFTPERKLVLDALRTELRSRNYSPVVFDFEKPASRDLTETISTLAHLSRFVIADLTDAKSIPQELAVIVPNLYSVAVQPIILEGESEYGMFEHWQRGGTVLPIYRYLIRKAYWPTFQRWCLAQLNAKPRNSCQRHCVALPDEG
jgi:hypothetical protein